MSGKAILIIAIAIAIIVVLILFRKQIMGEALAIGNRKCCKWDMTGTTCIAFEGDPICGTLTLT